MKVLVCHNRYRSNAPSGENRYVDEEIALLRSAGIDVIPMIEENDSIINGGPLELANAALGLCTHPRACDGSRDCCEWSVPMSSTSIMSSRSSVPLSSGLRRLSARLSSNGSITMNILA